MEHEVTTIENGISVWLTRMANCLDWQRKHTVNMLWPPLYLYIFTNMITQNSSFRENKVAEYEYVYIKQETTVDAW